MRIAVAYEDGMIGAHFGHAGMFAIYDYKDADVNNCVKQLLDTDGREGHEAMAALMREKQVDAVIAGSIGPAAKAALLSTGIVPIAGFEGSADDAADLLILGQLPILQGGEGGGCSGCAGGCPAEGGCSGCGPGCGGGCGC